MNTVSKSILIIALFTAPIIAEAQSDNATTENSNNTEQIDSVEFLYLGGYIIIPCTFTNGDNTLSEWIIFDTGTTGSMLISSASMKHLTGAAAPVAFIKTITAGTAKFDSTMIISVDHPAVSILDSMHRASLGDKKIIGLMGYPMMAKYITSIDYSKKKIFFKSLQAKQRTLFAKKPLAKVSYRNDKNTIWFPVTINKKVKGFAHVDSGYPYNWVEKRKVETKVTSFTIQDYDFMPMMNDLEFRPLNQENNYPNIKFNLISNVGNSFLERIVLTIDPIDTKLYFEELTK